MNLINWIILFVLFPPAAFLLAGVKLAGKLLKIVLLGYLVTCVLMLFFAVITV